MRPAAASPKKRTPTMWELMNANVVDIVERSMNGMSRPFSESSRPAPSFCLPIVTEPSEPSGIVRKA